MKINSSIFILLLFIEGLLVSVMLYLLARHNISKKKLQLEEYAINVNTGVTEEIFTLLDKIISECFSEYTILNIEYKDISYIDADLEKQITQNVAYKVIERLSPALLSKISLVYNINNFDKLISEKVYLYTLNYVISKNSIKK